MIYIRGIPVEPAESMAHIKSRNAVMITTADKSAGVILGGMPMHYVFSGKGKWRDLLRKLGMTDGVFSGTNSVGGSKTGTSIAGRAAPTNVMSPFFSSTGPKLYLYTFQSNMVTLTGSWGIEQYAEIYRNPLRNTDFEWSGAIVLPLGVTLRDLLLGATNAGKNLSPMVTAEIQKRLFSEYRDKVDGVFTEAQLSRKLVAPLRFRGSADTLHTEAMASQSTTSDLIDAHITSVDGIPVVCGMQPLPTSKPSQPIECIDFGVPMEEVLGALVPANRKGVDFSYKSLNFADYLASRTIASTGADGQPTDSNHSEPPPDPAGTPAGTGSLDKYTALSTTGKEKGLVHVDGFARNTIYDVAAAHALCDLVSPVIEGKSVWDKFRTGIIAGTKFNVDPSETVPMILSRIG